MNKETLIERRKAVEAKFNELADQKKGVEEELLKLQGEYRGLTELIDSEEPQEAEVIEPKQEKKQ